MQSENLRTQEKKMSIFDDLFVLDLANNHQGDFEHAVEIVDRIESLLSGNGESLRVKGAGIQLQGLVQTVLRVKPDFLLVLGDREESITTALVSTYMNIPLVHIGGGDRVVGNADDQIRHAVTKLYHLHFQNKFLLLLDLYQPYIL